MRSLLPQKRWAVKVLRILVLRRKTCALVKAKTPALLRRKTCAVLRTMASAWSCSEPLRRWRPWAHKGGRPSAAPFCGFLCVGGEQGTCPCSQHNTCLASPPGRCLGSVLRLNTKICPMFPARQPTLTPPQAPTLVTLGRLESRLGDLGTHQGAFRVGCA